ncbi:guanitoxin biosynthesis heme-dependent pre-guanitoxin N-hydroxylase GntA [Christiangramia sabulilitoris]|uniref:YqcI/YcgG family protein n=1 Tax=Christiangramia sabulilitoris TaxID=2583991 RepID=A0A550I078_9FLAO|nr:guanitoxin biosynthesis heme-dependent pre-guanitoxin N-hydroxylase GntA [Christiangramia sabulilitoris]TRO64387.1 YqcI/YcgG family protein [Christiangramia sabulilitoris]
MEINYEVPVKGSGKGSRKKMKIRKEFENFILGQDHPCIMAKTVFSMDQVEMHTYPDFGESGNAKTILKDLREYIRDYDFESNDFKTFLAVFPDSPDYSELEFENILWKQLENLHLADDAEWDKEVSPDPESEHFSFSLAGKAFYIVGMHPGASRMARQAPYTAIAFNLHWQFEKLREMGSYETVRDKIRERDKELQGSINPVLQDFGKDSEAKQYSGRKVEKEWKCPFHNAN